MVGALMVMPFIVTDFHVLAPDIPVRLGAPGAPPPALAGYSPRRPRAASTLWTEPAEGRQHAVL
jgi:hypothetical protein